MARETVATESHWTRFETHPENLLSLGPGEYRITFHKVYKCLIKSSTKKNIPRHTVPKYWL